MPNETDPTSPNATDRELDVRSIPKPQRHGRIFAEFATLAVGEALVLINDHEPKHLRDEFARELPGSYGWDALPGSSDEAGWRIRISKRTRTPLPRLVGDARDGDSASGSAWRLEPAARDLDANVIVLPAGDEIRRHDGPSLDVLLLVLSGSGTLETEGDPVGLRPDALVWLPARSQRRIVAGPEGLRYLSVHQRKPGLSISPAGSVPPPTSA
ncbi:DUF2249 domain-containing protein [Gulosibacter faecalis]|jgi:uncharacterized protein (DUF2249 family)/quercetin dioxygenase-like cupin family protein|uniref:DUF2249 domain-containing protein n=1 Tax=Gulosibacter faecalis TaxID=272240 RepID=A0ABW5UXE5_9MICO|nr:DUF2249 domain-containing protein [Gulosibacter faecalis]